MRKDLRSKSRKSFLAISHRREVFKTEPKDYEIVKIEGEYAYLHDLSGQCSEDLFVAMALLPPDCDIGTRLHCEMFTYTVIE